MKFMFGVKCLNDKWLDGNDCDKWLGANDSDKWLDDNDCDKWLGGNDSDKWLEDKDCDKWLGFVQQRGENHPEGTLEQELRSRVQHTHDCFPDVLEEHNNKKYNNK
ncbi:hypothetical protein CDAR_551341 [Caerostris darwini]|uniref:C-type lectin domain-containing protein n=1 Tax=Caerostris darwini TaxID=1538125 RepID=A0AAV4V7E1_9ARAC|nr:hypothetical protein CDAR_551341 [Caerostris darwini]